MGAKQKAAALGISIVTVALLSFISVKEGESLPVYADKLAGGLPTVCNGHTGPDVRLGDVWTKEQCDAVLIKNVQKHGEGFLTCISVAINQNEYEAYASLTFNLGVGAVCGSSIPRKLAAGQRQSACDTILEFNKVRDRTRPKVFNHRKQVWEYPLIPVRGLTLRRQAEHAICVRPMPTPGVKALA